MEMKHRSRSEITGAILAANGGGATNTTIMYKAVLSHDLMKQYLISLAENDLMEYEQGMMTYRTTEKGLHVLKLYNEMNQITRLSLIPTNNQNNDLFI